MEHEPPEMYCVKHEYVALLQNRRTEIESLKKRIWVLDEFILRVATLDNLDVRQQAVCFFFCKSTRTSLPQENYFSPALPSTRRRIAHRLHAGGGVEITPADSGFGEEQGFRNCLAWFGLQVADQARRGCGCGSSAGDGGGVFEAKRR